MDKVYVEIHSVSKYKVADFGTNRNHVCNFLLVINSNLGPILSHYRDIAGFAENSDPILLHMKFGHVPL